MSNINAKVIADSKNEFGDRITTMVVTFPRIILAELNTHRMFSRNSASSRAIPFKKMVKSVEENPFIPIAWQKDHKGMQGTEYITNLSHVEQCNEDWLKARDNAVNSAKELASGFPVLDKNFKQIGEERDDSVTKQLCNRLLEPFMWHTVLITATEWENFFALRCPKYNLGGDSTFRSWRDATNPINHCDYNKDASILDKLSMNKGQAEIHMMALAEAMWDAYNESTPKELKAGEWHIPYGDNIDYQLVLDTMVKLNQAQDSRTLTDPGGDIDADMEATINNGLIKIATAGCARVSYTVIGEEKKSSEQWQKMFPEIIVLDPDGWDRSNFDNSWAELITLDEYNQRVMHSTCQFKKGHSFPLKMKDNYENDIKLHDRLVESGHWSPLEHCARAMSLQEYHVDAMGFTLSKLYEGQSGNFKGFIQYRKMFNNENITK